MPVGSVSSEVDIAQAGEPAPQKRLRLWPGAVAVVLWLLVFVIPRLGPDNPTMILIPLGAGVLGGVVFIIWWVFFSREPRIERWAAIPLMIVAELVAFRFLHKSIATGHMGFTFPMYSIPTLLYAFHLWAVFSLRLSDGARRATMARSI